MSTRDQQRRFTPGQRAQLYVIQDGRCARCETQLEEGWHAHHVSEWGRGGVTQNYNALALCPACHAKEHGGKMKLREWQEEALVAISLEKQALVEATPGAGKTHLAGAWARRLIRAKEITHCVAVVPSRAIKDSVARTFHLHGVNTKPVHNADSGPPRQYNAIACTYQQLPNLVGQFESWVSNGARIGFVFDEIHHASEENVWGGAVEACARISTRILSMSGTPFRSDGRRISCISYDDDAKAIPSYSYDYRRGVREGVCRPLWFRVSGGEARVDREGDVELIPINGESEMADRGARFAMRDTTEFLRSLLQQSKDKLDELRRADPDAAMLVVCQPWEDVSGDRHAQMVARMIKRMFGENPEVVLCDDENGPGKIQKFKNGTGRFIVAVRMISEGVDIPRIRVITLATVPTRELLFRQIIGRAVRVESSGPADQRSFVFMPQTPQLVEMAKRIEEEADAGLRDRDEDEVRRKREWEREGPTAQDGPILVEATHEDGGVVHGGEVINRDAIERAMAAIQMLDDPRLSEAGPEALAKAFVAMKSADLRRAASPLGETPEFELRAGMREDINRLVRKIAHRQSLDHKFVWGKVHEHVRSRDINDLLDNKPIATVRLALDFLKVWALRVTVA